MTAQRGDKNNRRGWGAQGEGRHIFFRPPKEAEISYGFKKISSGRRKQPKLFFFQVCEFSAAFGVQGVQQYIRPFPRRGYSFSTAVRHSAFDKLPSDKLPSSYCRRDILQSRL